MNKPLDVFDLPLTGMQLIEASAGTGKTHTIGNLFVRLVVETGRPVDAILVLTFTKAATAELRDRIRTRLRDVATALRSGRPGDDDAFIATLIARVPDRAAALQRLEVAIAGFDQAAIHTIHAFCQRLLGDHALASGAPFAAEVVSEESELLAEVARDFWRREIYGATPLFGAHLLHTGIATPEDLLAPIRAHVNKPFLEVRGGTSADDCAACEAAFRAAYAGAAAVWRAHRDEVSAILLDSSALNRATYKVQSVRTWIDAFEQLFGVDAEPSLALPDFLCWCTPAVLEEKTKKGHSPPRHAFFERCETLLNRAAELGACFDARLLALRRRLLEYCNAEMARRKQHASVQSYDDLLNRLAAALQGANAAALIGAVRRQYSAALVDEFQDTDPVQYEIFRRLYDGSGLPLYLVGDPKQAIYGFRGADVYAYLNARAEAGRTHTLAVNWRSEPALIEAVNAVFNGAPQPFLLDTITFASASAAAVPRRILRINGEQRPPLVLWFLPRNDAGRPMTKGVASNTAAEVTAAEIARLLDGAERGEVCLVDADGRRNRLQGGDIAVLVRTHRQGQVIKRALAARGIHGVEQAEDSVFASEEAEEMTQLLRAVASPGDDALVRAAVTTAALGMRGEALRQLIEDERAWEALLVRFNDYHELWRNAGFFVMFRRLLEVEGVARRLLALRDGERSMTNLLHLAELMQAEAGRGRRGMVELINWLVQQRRDAATSSEEVQLRLESDEQLVQIVTVHRSKGLEFPIVFCPFAWDERIREENSLGANFFHDPAHGDAATLQLDGSDPQARAQAEIEARAESLRLFYVALTRAKNRCYLLWGGINGADRSAPAWLLHHGRGRFASDEDFFAWFRACKDSELRADLQALQARVPAAIRLEDAPAAESVASANAERERQALRARVFSGRIGAPWCMLSYSSLLRQDVADRPDHDAYAAAPTDTAEPARRDIFGFPRGARAGSCLHAILERADFAHADHTAWQAIAQQELGRHGFDAQWSGVLVQMLCDLVSTPLDDNGLRLAGVSADRRLNEWEFHYPLRRFAQRDLDRLLAPHDPQGWQRRQIEDLHFDPVAGYMKGYIDLVFSTGERWYIVDYKSNWLGARAEDYAAERLPAVMSEECYGLQYLIYTLALNRHLARRLPGYDYERHFGGVFYLFVRGVTPARGATCGVFHDRPPADLIAGLDRYIASGTP